jgi:putative hemolysin
MVAGQASLSADERAVITGALEVGERRLRDILIPRTDVFALPAELPAAAAAAEILQSGHTRAPVFRGSLDDMVGVVHLRELVGAAGTAGDLASPTLTLPDSSFALPALREMQRTRQQMALVADEYGGIEGIITIEDLVEEVVGEIYDEHDIDVTSAVRDADGAFLLPGSFPVHDLVDLGIALPHGRFTTVAGFIIGRLGRIPAEGDSVEESGWRFVVTDSSSTRITGVKVDRIATESQTGIDV